MPPIRVRGPLLAAALALTTAMGTVDDDGSDEPAPIDLTVLEQRASVAPGESFSIRLAPSAADGDIDGDAFEAEALDGLTVRVEVHPAVTSPLALAAGSAADTDGQGSTPSRSGSSPVTSVQAAAEVLVAGDGSFTLRLPIGDDVEGGELPLPGRGIYPLHLELTDGNGAVGRVETLVIQRPAPGQVPVRSTPTVILVEVGSGYLEPIEAVSVLGALGDRPATVVLHRDAVGALERDPDLAAALIEALAGRPVVLGTTTPLDPSALVAAGRPDAWVDALTRMRVRAQALGLGADPAITIVEAPLTAEGAALLVNHGITAAVGHRVPGADGPELWPPTTGFVDLAGAERLLVIGADRGRLAAQVSVSTDGLDQARLLGFEVASRALATEVDGTGTGSSTEASDGAAASGSGSGGELAEVVWVGGLARLDEPSEATAALMEPELGALLNPVDPAWLIDRTATTDGPRLPEPAPGGEAGAEAAARGGVALLSEPIQDLSPASEALARIDGLLGRYGLFHGGGSRPPDHYRNVLLEAFRIDVSAATRTTTLARIETELVESFTTVELPGNQPVTLAAQSAPLPVAVVNNADGPRFVRVAVTSDSIELAEPDLILTVEPGAGVVDVPVRTRSLGASPVTVSLLTPDGGEVLASTRFQVRSTAVPGLGLALAGGGLAALAFWWYASLRRRAPASGEAPPGREGAHRGDGDPADDHAADQGVGGTGSAGIGPRAERHEGGVVLDVSSGVDGDDDGPGAEHGPPPARVDAGDTL